MILQQLVSPQDVCQLAEAIDTTFIEVIRSQDTNFSKIMIKKIRE
jgi:hypothetical protein